MSRCSLLTPPGRNGAFSDAPLLFFSIGPRSSLLASHFSPARYNRLVDERREPPKVASEHDREHSRKIGRWKEESHAEALRQHLALPPEERLIAALRFALMKPVFEPQYPLRDDDDPGVFYVRAKKLGLYRS